MKTTFFSLLFGTIFLMSCNSYDPQCMESLEASSGRIMPSYTECLDQYNVDDVEVFHAEMGERWHREFLIENGFVNVCEDSTMRGLSCEQKVKRSLKYVKDEQIHQKDLMISYWTSISTSIHAIANMKNGSVWFVIKKKNKD